MFLDHKLPLNYYLLKPVQRLLKYPLLLREMVKATSAEQEPADYAALEEASSLMGKVAETINEVKRNGDITKYVKGLQERLVGWDGPNLSTFGKLKDAGEFKVADASNKRSSRQVLLFEYGILICKPRAGSFVTVKHHFRMSELFLQTMLNDPILFRLTLASNKKVFFTFYCQSQEDKQYWTAKIKKVMIDFYRNIGTADHAHAMAEADQHDKKKSAAATSSPSSTRRRIEMFQRKATVRKRTSLAAAFATFKAPVQRKAETDATLTHNPFAHAGGFLGEAVEVKQIKVKTDGSAEARDAGGGDSKLARGARRSSSPNAYPHSDGASSKMSRRRASINITNIPSVSSSSSTATLSGQPTQGRRKKAPLLPPEAAAAATVEGLGEAAAAAAAAVATTMSVADKAAAAETVRL